MNNHQLADRRGWAPGRFVEDGELEGVVELTAPRFCAMHERQAVSDADKLMTAVSITFERLWRHYHDLWAGKPDRARRALQGHLATQLGRAYDRHQRGAR